MSAFLLFLAVYYILAGAAIAATGVYIMFGFLMVLILDTIPGPR